MTEMDEALVGIMEAAERGAEVPHVALFTGSTMLYGLPVGSSAAAELMRRSLAEAFFNAAQVKKRNRDEVYDLSWQEADAQMASFGDHLGDQSHVISLSEVTISVVNSAEEVRTPVVRVPIESVDSWFTGTFEVKTGGGRGAFFILGPNALGS